MTQLSSSARGPDRPLRGRWGLKIAVAVVIALLGNIVWLIREAQDGNGDRMARLKALERRANPFMLRFAGTLPWGLARLEHLGRRSGRTYVTPLLAEPVRSGFMIAMPYGSGADWSQNLTAAGGGVLQHHGVRYSVSHPRVISTGDARAEMPALLRVLTWLLGIRNVMRVEASPALATEIPATA